MILHEIRRPNSLKTVPSGVANCRNLPFGGRATRGSRVRFPKNEKMRGVATNVYLLKMSGKPKETGQNENSKFRSCIYV